MNPIYIPTIPPMAVKMTAEKEIKPEPHSDGISPPRVEPTMRPVMMRVLRDTR